jgi:hypothetical protein
MSSFSSRSYRDADGVDWLVHYVEPQAFSRTLLKLQENARSVHGGERRQPRLVFHSSQGEKRRLSPVPEHWSTCSEADLASLCQQAVQVPPAPTRRAVED